MDQLTMSVKEMAKQMGICIPKAYELAKRKDFPALVLGKRIVIPVHAFEKWLVDNAYEYK